MGETKKIDHVFTDVWVEKGYFDPLGVINFTFSSEEAFTANHPINVKVNLLITNGLQKELLPIDIHFPDAFNFPRETTGPSGVPPVAGIVKIGSDLPYEGEAVIEFTQSGSFGYTIFSKGKPRYVAAQKKIITISPDTRAILDKIDDLPKPPTIRQIILEKIAELGLGWLLNR